ncbi:MAG: PAS domain S-box protein, partial [Bacillota bacterium]|nr:PAS domain S-box protein [Bacillota bacterium]
MKQDKEKYRLLLENLPDAFAYHQVVTDNEGAPIDYIFLKINAAFEEMTGLKREKVIGKKMTEVLPEIRKSGFDLIDIYGKLALSSKPASFENYSEPLNRWYDVSVYSVKTGYFATVFHDITECKQAEEIHRQNEENYRQILENITDVIWIADKNLETIYVSPSVEIMLGESASEHMSKNLDQKLTPDSLEKVILLMQEEIEKETNPASDKKRSRLIEVEHYRADGSIIWVAMHISFLRDDAGNITGLLGITRDISEQKKVEKDLRESEMRSQALIKAIPDLLFRFNRKGVYLEAVVKDETMLHAKSHSLYQQNRLIGKTMFETLPTPIAQKLMAGINKALDSGEMQVFEYSYEAKGSKLFLEARLAPIGDIEVVSIVRDVTERKSHEAILQYIGFHDQLTGLYNRRYYENELKRLDSSREHPIAVISADIDGLKLINDTLGHSEGDNFLKTGAELLKSALRTSDILARVGGDEFAVVLPNTTLEVGQRMVERIHHKIEEHNRQKTTGPPFSMSIGLAVSEP